MDYLPGEAERCQIRMTKITLWPQLLYAGGAGFVCPFIAPLADKIPLTTLPNELSRGEKIVSPKGEATTLRCGTASQVRRRTVIQCDDVTQKNHLMRYRTTRQRIGNFHDALCETS